MTPRRTQTGEQSARASADRGDADRLARVLQKLEARYGVPRHSRRGTVLRSLVHVILSQNTTDHNRDLAAVALFGKFPSPEALARARPDAIARAVRPAGLARQRAATIKRVLAWARRAFGAYSLEHIRKMDVEDAIEAMTSVKGVGVKSAAVVLLFECRKQVMPVDTHVARVSRRLGFGRPNDTPDAIFRKLRPLVPARKSLNLHMGLIRFGRDICAARKPRCDICPLFALCQWQDKETFAG